MPSFQIRSLAAALLCCLPIATQAQVHVDTDAPNGGDGSTWANAYNRLDVALSSHPGEEIWVARGRYVPPLNANPDLTPSEKRQQTSFLIPPGTRLYGGFDGSESARDERDLHANPTVLSGDMQANDSNRDARGVTPTPDNIVGDNARHVVRFEAQLWGQDDGTSIGPDTVLDGFIITAGFASSTLYEGGGGGAVCIAAYETAVCSPTLRNLEFVGNLASGGGGAFAVYSGGAQASPRLENVVFRNNRSSSEGGAVIVSSFWAVMTPSFADVEFIDNEATSGGAVALTEFFDVTIDRARFVGNRARRDLPENTLSNVNGGAIYVNGGFLFEDSFARARINNAVFVGNSAENLGGVLMNRSDGAATRVTFANSSFSGNRARLGGVLFVPDVDGPVTVFHNSILWGNTATQPPADFDAFAAGAGDNIYGDYSEATSRVEIGHSLLQHGLAAPGVVYSQGYETFATNRLVNLGSLTTADPLFAGAELRLRKQSPAIDTGNNAYNTTTLDLDGNARVAGARIDRGAFEFIDNGCDGRPDSMFCDGFEQD